VQAIRRLRLAAYAICLRDDQILLARYVRADGESKYWTLPGGGVEHGEDPIQAVLREVEEETGYQIRVGRLLGIELHHVCVVYRAEITGGELRPEMSGSTDLAAWIGLTAVPDLDRAVIIDTAIGLHQQMPPDGHIPPIPVGGLLRY
jgi:8-oxo-dGTP diphosphatase